MTDADVKLGDLTLGEFIDRLASEEPVPGGGSASAVAGSLAAALLVMVARLSMGRPKYAAYQSTNERALSLAESARVRLLQLADDDARAYGKYAAARKMVKETSEQQAQRAAAIRAAARAASEVPLTVARECAVLLEEIAVVAGRSNLNAASDLEVGARLCAAAARGAAANVMINLPQVEDERFAGVSTAELNGLLQDIDRNVSQVAQRVARGSLRDPEPA